MDIFSRISVLQNLVSELKKEGKSIGFIPTMGALHEGHIGLVGRSLKETDVTVVSIFVNPTQFNDQSDLANYPRTLEADCEKLKVAGCHIVFAPEVTEIYPEPDNRVFDLSPLDLVMEGPSRPGHFNGVVQVVSRLFDAVTPDKAYFGLKDFQQLAIINRMVEMLDYQIEIVPCPIIRETDGLAMSSRNVRLTAEHRQKAPKIYATLKESLSLSKSESMDVVKRYVEECIKAEPAFKIEYFEMVDGHTLQPIYNWQDATYIVGCIALYCGEVRLIDNIIYRSEENFNS